MAQELKHLPRKHKTWSANSNNVRKKIVLSLAISRPCVQTPVLPKKKKYFRSMGQKYSL
jgi:hypothetical protein